MSAHVPPAYCRVVDNHPSHLRNLSQVESSFVCSKGGDGSKRSSKMTPATRASSSQNITPLVTKNMDADRFMRAQRTSRDLVLYGVSNASSGGRHRNQRFGSAFHGGLPPMSEPRVPLSVVLCGLDGRRQVLLGNGSEQGNLAPLS